jgi:hypothetical protein
MEKEVTHWKQKLTDVNWIGTYILPNGMDIIVKLLRVEWKEDLKVMGQAKKSFVAYFGDNKYFDKPMLLNKTNLSRITKITGTPNPQEWINLNMDVILCQEMDKAIGGGKDWALRIKEYNKPILILDSANFIKVKDAITNGKATIEQVETKYKLSKEVRDAII